MSGSIKRNLGLQTVYQILNTCLPLVTAPYLARVLGASMLGVFSYTSSVVAYFSLVAMLGTVNYGTRSIAEKRGNKKELSETFWSIYILQFSTTLLALVAYSTYLIYICKSNLTIAIIQSLTLIACLFDINWLFFGVEDFVITVTRNIIIKVVTVGAILIFVKKPSDLWIYTVIMLAGNVFSQIVLWFYLPRYVAIVHINWREIVSRLKPNIVLFIPLLAMSVYHTMDKTMLGAISTYEQTGFYYNADKVINIPLCILNGVGTVMLPRMTGLFNAGKRKEADQLLMVSLEGITFISVAFGVGIASVAEEFVPIFFGEGYTACIILTIVLSPVLIIKGISNTIRTQYLVPLNMENVFIKSVVSGALINLFFNLLLIPKLGAMGAVIGTLVAELVACILQFLAIRKMIYLKKYLMNVWVYVCVGILMFICVRVVGKVNIHRTMLKLCIECIIGAIVYLGICGIFWKKENNNMFQAVFKPIIKKFLR